ncbi:hypothetical protein ACGYQ5_14305 [Burkholderia pseudomallei]
MKTSGETIELDDRPHSIGEIKSLIGADVIDSRVLHDPGEHVLIFDDVFLDKRLPLNIGATVIYHAAGYSKEQQICGDVVLVPDADFARHT